MRPGATEALIALVLLAGPAAALTAEVAVDQETQIHLDLPKGVPAFQASQSVDMRWLTLTNPAYGTLPRLHSPGVSTSERGEQQALMLLAPAAGITVLLPWRSDYAVYRQRIAWDPDHAAGTLLGGQVGVIVDPAGTRPVALRATPQALVLDSPEGELSVPWAAFALAIPIALDTRRITDPVADMAEHARSQGSAESNALFARTEGACDEPIAGLSPGATPCAMLGPGGLVWRTVEGYDGVPEVDRSLCGPSAPGVARTPCGIDACRVMESTWYTPIPGWYAPYPSEEWDSCGLGRGLYDPVAGVVSEAKGTSAHVSWRETVQAADGLVASMVTQLPTETVWKLGRATGDSYLGLDARSVVPESREVAVGLAVQNPSEQVVTVRPPDEAEASNLGVPSVSVGIRAEHFGVTVDGEGLRDPPGSGGRVGPIASDVTRGDSGRGVLPILATQATEFPLGRPTDGAELGVTETRNAGPVIVPQAATDLVEVAAPAAPLVVAGLALLLPLWALYRRIAKAEALRHAQRGALYRRIAEAPGMTPADLANAVGLQYMTCRHHLAVLEDLGLIEVRRMGGRLRCFQAMSHGRLESRILAASRTPTVRQLLEFVGSEPGTTVGDAAAHLGVRPSTITYHSRRLQRDGVLESKRDGMCVRISLVPGASAILGVLTRRPLGPA